MVMLHARRLELIQPRTGAPIRVVAPFPETEPLWAALETGGADGPSAQPDGPSGLPDIG